MSAQISIAVWWREHLVSEDGSPNFRRGEYEFAVLCTGLGVPIDREEFEAVIASLAGSLCGIVVNQRPGNFLPFYVQGHYLVLFAMEREDDFPAIAKCLKKFQGIIDVRKTFGPWKWSREEKMRDRRDASKYLIGAGGNPSRRDCAEEARNQRTEFSSFCEADEAASQRLEDRYGRPQPRMTKNLEDVRGFFAQELLKIEAIMTVWRPKEEYLVSYERHELSCSGGWEILSSLESLLNEHFSHRFFGSPVQFSQAECEVLFYERNEERAVILEVTAAIPQPPPLSQLEVRFRIFIEPS